MCFALERVFRGEIRRLIITVPPRYLKSVTTSMAFVAWVLGHDPSKKIMVASYGSDLGFGTARGFRAIIEHPTFHRLFPRFKIHPSRNTLDEVGTTMRGGRKTVSVGGSVTGHGADILIIDDLLKAADANSEPVRTRANEFFNNSLYSRLDIKSEASIIVIQQRLHEDDLIGHLLEQGGWEHINMPAIADQDISYPLYSGRSFKRVKGDLLAPEFEDHEVLAEHLVRMGPVAYQAQYMLDPMPPDGNRISWGWFGSYDVPLNWSEYSYVVQSWDTAASDEPGAAYSVCMTFGFEEGRWELLDIFRDRLKYPDLRRMAIRLYREWEPDKVIIENASTGISLAQDMWEALGIPRRSITPYQPLKSKEERLDIQSAKIEQGLIVLPEQAPWLAAFKNELMRFPNGTYMDQVDALTQFLEWTSTTHGRSVRPLDPRTGRPTSPPRPHSLRAPGR